LRLYSKKKAAQKSRTADEKKRGGREKFREIGFFSTTGSKEPKPKAGPTSARSGTSLAKAYTRANEPRQYHTQPKENAPLLVLFREKGHVISFVGHGGEGENKMTQIIQNRRKVSITCKKGEELGRNEGKEI